MTALLGGPKGLAHALLLLFFLLLDRRGYWLGVVFMV